MRTYVFVALALLAALCTLTGCASIVSSGPKTLPIMSQPDEATVEITSIKTGDIVFKAKTPYTAFLRRDDGFFSKAKYKIKISKDNYLPQEQQIEARLNGWYWGNIVFGGLIGWFIVDPATGAMWKINEENINVKLYPDTPDGKVSMAQEINGRAMEDCTNGNYDKAIEATTQAITLYPEYAEAYCTRAKALAGKDENDKAMQDLNKAVSIKPDYAEALFQRGSIYHKQKNLESAKSDMKASCGMNFKNACDYKF